MDCRDAEDLLVRRQDRQTSAAEEAQLEEHLVGCLACRQFQAGLRKTQELLERERSAQAKPIEPSALWERVSAALTEPASPPQPRRGWMRVALAGAGLALAASILVALGLWRWAVGVQRQMEDLEDVHRALRLRYDELQAQAAPPGPDVVSLVSAELDRSTRLYQKLAEFYRLPVLWVAEGRRGAEMKLGADELTTEQVSEPVHLVFLRVSLSEGQEAEPVSFARLISRPGQHVFLTLDASLQEQGRWRLECVPDVTEGGLVNVRLEMQRTDAGEQAALSTTVTLAPRTVVEAGSLLVDGHLYVVRVLSERVAVSLPQPNDKAEVTRT